MSVLGRPTFSQIENRNFLMPTGWHFNVVRAPKVSFFGTKVNVPTIDLGVAIQANYLNDIPRAGDKMNFGDLTLEFLVDENLENYMEIQKWMRGLGFPESLDEIYEWQRQTEGYDYPNNYRDEGGLNLYSDGTLTIYNSAQQPAFKVVFENLFPVNLTLLQFDAQTTDETAISASATFKYSIYNIREIECC